jgi:hypothetical protein
MEIGLPGNFARSISGDSPADMKIVARRNTKSTISAADPKGLLGTIPQEGRPGATLQ